MNYITTCILLGTSVSLPAMGLLLWQMGPKNWPKWLLIMPSIALMDLDHFLLTNIPGFGVHPKPGQKLLHVAHTIEFVILEIAVLLVIFLLLDRRQGRSLKAWLFPRSSDYSKPGYYYLAWTVRILILGVVIHWLQDLLIYSYFQKWNYLYISLIEYFLNPT